MTVTQERPQPQQDEAAEQGTSWRRMVLAGAGTLVALLVVLWFFWPAGVALGLVLGVLATWKLGTRMHAAALAEPVDPGLLDGGDEELRQELRRLRVRLGDDWSAFRTAAVRVVEAQAASVAGLQRWLGCSTGQAQHLMRLLEREGFVGPARGTQPRRVLIDRDRAPLLEQMLQS